MKNLRMYLLGLGPPRFFILRGQMSLPRRNGRSIDGNSRGQTKGTSEVRVSY